MRVRAGETCFLRCENLGKFALTSYSTVYRILQYLFNLITAATGWKFPERTFLFDWIFFVVGRLIISFWYIDVRSCWNGKHAHLIYIDLHRSSLRCMPILNSAMWWYYWCSFYVIYYNNNIIYIVFVRCACYFFNFCYIYCVCVCCLYRCRCRWHIYVNFIYSFVFRFSMGNFKF